MLSGRGLCDELITRPEESYRLCCVVVCDLETSRIGAPYMYDISNLRVNSNNALSPATERNDSFTDNSREMAMMMMMMMMMMMIGRRCAFISVRDITAYRHLY